MLVWNPSIDGGTFDPETRLQKFQRWVKERQAAQSKMDAALATGDFETARKHYQKINKIENRKS